MNKIISLALASTLVFSSMAAIPNEANATSKSATVKSKSIIYKNVNKKKKVLTLVKGKKVTVVKKTGSWTKVKYGKKTGYIQTKKLTFISTARQLENVAKVKGALLLKKRTAFLDLASKGKMDTLYNTSYENLSKATIDYSEYVTGLKVSAAVKKKLTTSYTKKAESSLERFSEEVEAWRLLVATSSSLKNYEYDKAEASFTEATEAYARSTVLKSEKGYAGISGELKTTLDNKFKTLNSRFTSSTLKQLADEGHIWLVGEGYFQWNTTKKPYTDSKGIKHTGGIVTTGNNKAARIFAEFPNVNGKALFKNVTMTLSLGDYWNKNKLPKTAEVKIGDTVYSLAQGDEPIKINIDLTNRTSLEFYFANSSSLKQIGLTDIHFNR